MFFLLLQTVLASEGEYGRNFMLSLQDVDGVLAGQTPTLWVLTPDSVSLQFPLTDDGIDADQVEGNGLFSGTVNELPDPPMRLVLQNGDEELWRKEHFVLPGDLEYPALRLVFEQGEVTGGLQADLSPDALRALEAAGAAPPSMSSDFPGPPFDEADLRGGSPWGRIVLGFFGGLISLIGGRKLVQYFRVHRPRFRNVKKALAQRGSEWDLGAEFPVLRDGLQIWSSGVEARVLRERICRATEPHGCLFWVSPGGHEGLSDGAVRWRKEAPSAGEAIYWRGRLFPPSLAGPLFIEGLEALHSGELQDAELLQDLSEMAWGPIVLLSRPGQLPEGWEAEELGLESPQEGGVAPLQT